MGNVKQTGTLIRKNAAEYRCRESSMERIPVHSENPQKNDAQLNFKKQGGEKEEGREREEEDYNSRDKENKGVKKNQGL